MVPEKVQYEHIGVIDLTYENNGHVVKGRLGKVRTALNISTGLGIKKKGLNLGTCDIIFVTLSSQ